MTSTNIKEGKAQVRNNERINSGLELGINVCFVFALLLLLLKSEVNISVFVSGQNNDTWNYVWLGEFGQVSSRSI